MIINEQAGSGGDLLPFLFRQMEIGTLVGTTHLGRPGGHLGHAPLRGRRLDDCAARRLHQPEGEWDVEGIGVAPDILVEMTPGT
jgi:tricorn protease